MKLYHHPISTTSRTVMLFAAESDLSAYPNVRAWLARMKALKSWPTVWSVIDGFAESLKGKQMVAV